MNKKEAYARPPFPPALYERFKKKADELGWDGVGERWKLIEAFLDYSDKNPDLFRYRKGGRPRI